MYIDKKTRKIQLSRKSILFIVSILLVFLVLITGLIMLLTQGKEVKDTLVEMPFFNSDSYFAVDNTIVYTQNELLTCVDASLNTIWKLRLFTEGLNFTSNNDIIAATGQGVIQVVGSDSEHLFSTQLDGSIRSARIGSDKVAVYVEQALAEKTLSYIVVFDLSGNSLFKKDITGMCIVDYGFNSSSQQLYILELDVSSAAPVSRITTLRPETQSITGIYELKDQLIESVNIIDDTIYAMGTNRLTIYTSLNATEQEILVYGWVFEDMYISNITKFIYVPSTESPNDLGLARIISTLGDETTINLPPNVFSILYTREKIYCFATNNIFVYTSDGKYLRTHVLPFAIDSVERAMDDHVFITRGDTVYLLPLP